MYGLGGTGIISLDRAALMLIQQQNDKQGLGRWTCCLYKGKGNKVITVYSCYRPDDKQMTYKTQLAEMARWDTREEKFDNKKAWYEDLAK